MTVQNTDFGRVADDLRRAAASFALLTTNATAFGAALGAFRSFEKQLVSTNAIAQGTVATYQKMEKAARSFALATTTSAVEAVNALQNLAQAGFTAEESLQAMTGVLLLASATMVDAAVAADLISANVRAFGLSAGDTSRIANLFTAAINNGLASVDKLTFAMRQVAPVADVANLSIEQTTAYLNELFNVGLRGEQAGTALRNIIVRLIRPTGEAAKILREIGVATTDATGNFRDLETVLKEISAANLNEAQLAKIFENEALAGAITLMKSVSTATDGATSSYQKQLAAISDTQAALVLALKNLNSFDAAIRLTQNAVTDFAIEIGEALAPTIRELAAYVRDLLEQFRSLDPATKKIYTQYIAMGAAALGLLAGMNALILVFGSATMAIGKLSKLMLLVPLNWLLMKVTGTTTAMLAWRAAAVAIWTALRTFAIFLGGAMLTALNAVSAALIGLGANPVLLGISLVAIGIAGIVAGVKYLTAETKDAAKELTKLADIKFTEQTKAGTAQAGKRLEGIQSDLAIKEIQAQLQIARQLIDSDLVNLILDGNLREGIAAVNQGQVRAQIALEELQKSEQGILKEFEDIAEFREKRNKFIADNSKLTNTGSYLNPVFDFIVDPELLAEFDRQNAAAAAQLAALEERQKENETAKEDARKIIKDGANGELAAAQRLLENLRDGKEKLDKVFDDISPTLIALLQNGGPEFIKRVAADLAADKDGTITDEELAAIILTDKSVEGLDPKLLTDLFERRNKEKVRKTVEDLGKAVLDIETENEKLRIATLDYVAANSVDLKEALAAGLDSANSTVELKLTDLQTKFVADNGAAIQTFIQQSQEGINEAITAILDANGYAPFLDNPAIEELFGGAGFIEAVQAKVDANTTPEELAKIATQEAAKYKAVMLAIIEKVGASMNLSEDQLAQLRALVAAQIKRIETTIISGATESADSAAAIVERIKKDADNVDKEADKLLKKQRDLLKKQRAIEDLFLDAAKAGAEARKRYVEAVRGFSVNERIDLGLTFDISKINEDADNQLRELQRKIEDVSIGFEGTPAELAAIKEQYSLLTVEIEKARDAEIIAAQSWTSSMARRSASLDLFIRDLTDVGMAANDTFTQVGAGIASAFAEYQKDLVTLIDITKDATSGLLDTLTTGIADFIYDNENAWETFKKNMLNISRQIFEAFTKSFLQQAISSMTGGEGSILGNAVQPSPYGKTGTPGVGTGGFLGRLFPGLAGAMGGANATANAGLSSDPMTAALQRAAGQTSVAYNNHLSTMTTTFTQFETGMRGALNSVVTAINSMASQMGVPGAGGSGGMLGSIGNAVMGIPGVGQAAGAVGQATSAAYKAGTQIYDGVVTSLKDGIAETAKALQVDPMDLASIISYETGGTFNPMQAGPTTQWGQHRGLIQFGQPQAAEYGVDFSTDMTALTTQLGPNGAIVKYLTAHGFQPGMSKMDLYSTINAGAPGRYGASDAMNGGAAGDVFDKVTNQMGDHMKNAERLFGDFNDGLATSVDELGGVTGGITGLVNGLANPASSFDRTGVTPEALSALANLEQSSGRTFDINSAFRDAAHNADVGGAKGSQHIQGNAFDVNVTGYSTDAKNVLIEQARAAGFGGVGVYEDSLHFDTGAQRAWGSDYTSATVPSWAQQALQTQTGQPGLGGSNPSYMPVTPAGATGTGIPGVPGMAGGTGLEQITQLSQQLTQVMTQFVQSITQTLNQFGTEFTNALNAALQKMGGGGGLTFSPTGGGGGTGGGGLGSILGGLGSLFGGGFSEGGYTGDGGKFDPAGIVHAGEFVTNREATKQFGPLLQAINEGQVDPTIAKSLLRSMSGSGTPGYAFGGLVGGDGFMRGGGGMNGILFALLGAGLGGKNGGTKGALGGGLLGFLLSGMFGGGSGPSSYNMPGGDPQMGGGMGGLGGILSSLGGLFGGLFSEGGYTGDGAKFDPAGIVHAGEFVTNRDATREFGPLLQAINDGALKPETADAVMRSMLGPNAKGYARGGFASPFAGFANQSENRAYESMLGGYGGSKYPSKDRSQPRDGDKISLYATYNISGGQDADKFARSANQHAKVLMGRIERAKKNT